MFKRFSDLLEKGRMRRGEWGSDTGDDYGAFLIQGPCGTPLKIIASPGSMDGEDEVPWEHVSVSTQRRSPNWQEMSFVKDLFWEEEQTVMQLHPPRSQWINNHPFCLHLWRPLNAEIPLPPQIAVGIRGVDAGRGDGSHEVRDGAREGSE